MKTKNRRRFHFRRYEVYNILTGEVTILRAKSGRTLSRRLGLVADDMLLRRIDNEELDKV